MMFHLLWIVPLAMVSAMVLCWYFGAIPLLLLMPHFYEGCYAMAAVGKVIKPIEPRTGREKFWPVYFLPPRPGLEHPLAG